MFYAPNKDSEAIPFVSSINPFLISTGARRSILYEGTLWFKNNYSEDDNIKKLEFLVDNIFVVFCVGKVP